MPSQVRGPVRPCLQRRIRCLIRFAPASRQPRARSTRPPAVETAMIRAFQRLFESTVATAARAAEVDEREHGYHVATAALLVEVMRADYEVRPEERDAVLRALGAAFDDLSPDETRDLLARAEEARRRRDLPLRVHAAHQPAARSRAEGTRRRAAVASRVRRRRSRQVRGAPGATNLGSHPRPALGLHPDEAQRRAPAPDRWASARNCLWIAQRVRGAGGIFHARSREPIRHAGCGPALTHARR